MASKGRGGASRPPGGTPSAFHWRRSAASVDATPRPFRSSCASTSRQPTSTERSRAGFRGRGSSRGASVYGPGLSGALPCCLLDVEFVRRTAKELVRIGTSGGALVRYHLFFSIEHMFVRC